MDARSSRIEKVAIAVLAALLAVGLWQAYGYWLFGVAGHGA